MDLHQHTQKEIRILNRVNVPVVNRVTSSRHSLK
jgi:hypothetical protein